MASPLLKNIYHDLTLKLVFILMPLQFEKEYMKNVFIIFLSFYTSYLFAEESVLLNKSRIIYNESDKRNSVDAENKSQRQSYLVQAWIENEEHQITKDFIVTPPLHVSRPGMEKSIEIWKVNAKLPSDKERLYYFFEKAIPSLDKKDANNGISIATGNRIKLIYRPNGLKMSLIQVKESLVFKCQQGHLIIENPTPFYITFTKVNILREDENSFMIPPESTLTIKGKVRENGKKITYSIINDFGNEEGPFSADIML